MEINDPGTAPIYAAGELRAGTLHSKALLQGEEGSPNNYRFSFETAGEDSWGTPRHRHNFDQVRLQLKGSFTYAKGKSLTPGWVGYFPEAIHYGPQLREPGAITVVLQMGGASGLGFMSPGERRRGYDALAANGSFDGTGAYTYLDEKGKRHNKDAYEAVWEYIRGRDMEYPEPRYDGLINMNTTHYEWVPDSEQKGVSLKRLGSFTERNFEIGFAKIEPGATFKLSAHTAPQVLFLTEGSVAVKGKAYGPHTAFGLATNEGPAEFKAEKPSVIFFIKLATFAEESGKVSKKAA